MDIYSQYKMTEQYRIEEDSAMEQIVEEEIRYRKYLKYLKCKRIKSLKTLDKCYRIVPCIYEDDIPF